MAWFRANKNEGYSDHGLRPLTFDKRPIIGYSEGYVTKSEEIVEFRRVSAMTNHKGSSRIMEFPFWSSARDQPEKGDDYSPKVRDVVYRDNSPTSRDHYRGKYNNFNNNHKDDDIVCKDGVCFKDNKGGATKPNYPEEEDHENEKHKEKHYPPSSYTIPSSNQPRKDTYYASSYPEHNEKYKENGHYAPSSSVPLAAKPRKDTFESSYPDNDGKSKGNGYYAPRPIKDAYHESSYPENNEKHKGNGYYAPRPIKDAYHELSYPENNEKHKGNGDYGRSSSFAVSTQPRKDTYNESSYPGNNEKHKGNGYYAPSAPVPVSTQPKKVTYFESSYPDNDEKHKGNDYHAPQPRKDTYYETSNNRPIVTNLPPIKTRSDRIGSGNESPKNSPGSIAGQHKKFNASPRKDEGYEEIIDSAEARRRYGKAPPRAEEKYTGIIDSKTAARKYNGVFVP